MLRYYVSRLMNLFGVCVGCSLFAISHSASGESNPDVSSELIIGPPYKEVLDAISKKFPVRVNLKTNKFIIYYCWPDSDKGFYLLTHEKCSGMEWSHSSVIEVTYNYFPEGKDNVSGTYPSYLEGALGVKLPYDFNLLVGGKTPYESAYEKYNSDVVKGRIKVISVDNERFEGLSLYLTESGYYRYKVGSDISDVSRYWVSANDYETRIGNPLLVVCRPLIDCHARLDMGNGWIMKARFQECMLYEWELLLKNLMLSEKGILR